MAENVLLRKENYTEEQTKVFKQEMIIYKAQFKQKWIHSQIVNKYFAGLTRNQSDIIRISGEKL